MLCFHSRFIQTPHRTVLTPLGVHGSPLLYKIKSTH
nr:MAG TPA: hypothetical protein [Caudoviricetes sp.]DAY99752.1 MAG TPA: hypothetical protein [Caudoviricetes sp.]